ncbi:MAG: hypothetical protein AAFX44_06590 [Pseudomonadota bacterium]
MATKVATQFNLLLNPLLQLVLEPLAADPSATLGRVYWNTTADEARIYDGSSWVSLTASGGGSMTAGEILTALLTVDGTGSLLDADLLDGQEAAAFAQAVHTHASTQITDFTAAVQTIVNATIDGAPGALDTLNELAAALGDDPDFATTVTNLINGRADTYSVQIGDGAATAFAVVHNLNNTEAVVQVYEVATGEVVLVDIRRDSANQHTVTFASAPGNNAYEVVVHA